MNVWVIGKLKAPNTIEEGVFLLIMKLEWKVILDVGTALFFVIGNHI